MYSRVFSLHILQPPPFHIFLYYHLQNKHEFTTFEIFFNNQKIMLWYICALVLKNQYAAVVNGHEDICVITSAFAQSGLGCFHVLSNI